MFFNRLNGKCQIGMYRINHREFPKKSFAFGTSALILIFLAGLTSNTEGQTQSLGKIDFGYSPLWWQSIISLPDDKDKILVGKEGQLLFDWKGIGFRGFALQLQVEVGKTLNWKRQETYSARVPIVRTFGDAVGVEVSQETFVVPPRFDERARSGKALPRRILLVITVRNNTDITMSREIGLLIRSKEPVTFNNSNQTVHAGNSTIISSDAPFKFAPAKDSEKPQAMQLKLVLQPAELQQYVFTVDRNQRESFPHVTVDEVPGLRDATCQWWEKSGLPYNAVEVPDSGIQAMFESCVRNIWQARDIENGKIAYKVGPTIYRQLFVVDGAFLLETAAMLGRAIDARDGLEFMLGHQEEDGSFQVINRYYGVKGYSKENGIMLWAVLRHAQLSQDKQWLRSKWLAIK